MDGSRWRRAFYGILVVLGTALGISTYLLWDARRMRAEPVAAPTGEADRLRRERDGMVVSLRKATQEIEAAQKSLDEAHEDLATAHKELDDARRELEEARAAPQADPDDEQRAKDLAEQVAALQRALSSEKAETKRLEAAHETLAAGHREAMARATSAESRLAESETRVRELDAADREHKATLAATTRNAHFVLRNDAGPAFLEWALVVSRDANGDVKVDKKSYAQNGQGWHLRRGRTLDLGPGIFVFLYIKPSADSTSAYTKGQWTGKGGKQVVVLDKHRWG